MSANSRPKTTASTQTIASAVQSPPAAKPWRDSLSPDELVTVQRAIEHAEFWQGAYSNNPLMLVAKLVALLDEQSLSAIPGEQSA